MFRGGSDGYKIWDDGGVLSRNQSQTEPLTRNSFKRAGSISCKCGPNLLNCTDSWETYCKCISATRIRAPDCRPVDRSIETPRPKYVQHQGRFCNSHFYRCFILTFLGIFRYIRAICPGNLTGVSGYIYSSSLSGATVIFVHESGSIASRRSRGNRL